MPKEAESSEAAVAEHNVKGLAIVNEFSVVLVDPPPQIWNRVRERCRSPRSQAFNWRRLPF